MNVHFFALLLIQLWAKNVSGQGLEFYVSVDGSDSWDGTAESNIDGSDVGPWQTLNHAIDELRRIRPNPPTAESQATIYLLPGMHFLTSTIAMNQKDSFLTLKSLYAEEEVAVSGGMVLDGEWIEDGSGIRTIKFEGSCSEAYVGSQRLIPARSANLLETSQNVNLAGPPYNIIKGLLVETETCKRNTTAYSQNCPDEDREGFIFEDEFSPDWSFLEQTKVLIYHSGIAEFAFVGNITEENGDNKVFFTSPLTRDPIGNVPKSSGWRFLIFNNLALLDIPGECVCNDMGDGTAQFSYIPPEGPEFEGLPVIVAKLNPLINSVGATDVLMEGIQFSHSSSDGAINSDFGQASALRIISTENFNIIDCKFTQTGMTGVYSTDSSNVQITRSVFTDIGYHAIQFHYKQESDELEGQQDVSIDNNMFDGCGVNNFWQPACVKLGGYKNMTIRNNEFTSCPYHHIRITGLMPHGATYWDDNGITEPTRDDYIFHIEYNYISQFGMGILNDMGAVYISRFSCDLLTICLLWMKLPAFRICHCILLVYFLFKIILQPQTRQQFLAMLPQRRTTTDTAMSTPTLTTMS